MSYRNELKNIGDRPRDDFANEAIKILSLDAADDDARADRLLTLAVRTEDPEFSEKQRDADFAELKREIAEL